MTISDLKAAVDAMFSLVEPDTKVTTGLNLTVYHDKLLLRITDDEMEALSDVGWAYVGSGEFIT